MIAVAAGALLSCGSDESTPNGETFAMLPDASNAAFAADDDALFIGTQTAVTRIAFATASATTLVGFKEEGPGGIALTTNDLWFRDEGYTVARIAKAGGEKKTVYELELTGTLTGSFAVDANTLYAGQYLSSQSGDIFVLDAKTLLPKDVWHSPTPPVAILIDANAVFWIEEGGDVHRRAPTDTADTVIGHLISGITGDTAVQDGSNVYVYDQGVSAILRISKDGTGTANIVSVNNGKIDAPSNLAVDENNIYWLSYRERIYRAPRTGGAAELLAAPANDVSTFSSGLVLHGDQIYWAAPSTKTIRRSAK